MKTQSQHRFPFAPGVISGGPRRSAGVKRRTAWLDRVDDLAFFIALGFVLALMLALGVCILFPGLLGFNILDGAPFL